MPWEATSYIQERKDLGECVTGTTCFLACAFWRVVSDKAVFLARPLHLLNLYSFHPAPRPAPSSLFLQPGSALLKFRAGENPEYSPIMPHAGVSSPLPSY